MIGMTMLLLPQTKPAAPTEGTIQMRSTQPPFAAVSLALGCGVGACLGIVVALIVGMDIASGIVVGAAIGVVFGLLGGAALEQRRAPGVSCREAMR
jgi:hypothetical protein